MKPQAKTLSNLIAIAKIGDGATTPELADVLKYQGAGIAGTLRRYEVAGYLTSKAFEDVREDKNGHCVTRTIFRWSPTDRLREVVEAAEAEERSRKPVRFVNSVFALGQL